MYKRKSMPRKKDQKVFNHTVNVGKAVNVRNHPARGGIRM